jgi:hypothetical protein
VSGSVDFFGRLFAGDADAATVEGRAFFYNFDFLKFRGRAEESLRVANRFQCQGICWKFRFAGKLEIYINGHRIINLSTDQDADAFPLAIPLAIVPEDDVCVAVWDTQPRWFRWFRPNTAHVTLEGLECMP